MHLQGLQYFLTDRNCKWQFTILRTLLNMDSFNLSPMGKLNVENLKCKRSHDQHFRILTDRPKACRDNVPPVLYRLWTDDSSIHVLPDGTERGDVNKIDRMGTRASLEGEEPDSMFDMGDNLKVYLKLHLDGNITSSNFSSWTHSLLTVLARAKEAATLEHADSIYISIMITSAFEDREIYYVPDIYQVGFQATVPAVQVRPHEFVVHGPIKGPGLATLPLSVWRNSLGTLWAEIPTCDTWDDCHNFASHAFRRELRQDVDERFGICARTAQYRIMSQFGVIDRGAFKFAQLYITAQLYCMRQHFWCTPALDTLNGRWFAAMTTDPLLVGLSETQRNWGGGLIPRIHEAIEPRHAKPSELFPDVRQTLFLLGHFGKTLMEYGKTFYKGGLGAAGDLAELSPDYILAYLGFMLIWDKKSYQYPAYWLSDGWKNSNIDYWKPFKDWRPSAD